MNSFQIKRAFRYVSYHLTRPHRKGHGIHSPFAFDFIQNVVLVNSKQPLKKIINLQNELKRIKKPVNIEDYGAGSKKIKPNNRNVGEIARYAGSSFKKGNLLYNIVRYYKPDNIIELGTSLGFGTMYMAKASPLSKIFTIEGSKELSELAIQNFDRLKMNNIKVIHGLFDEVFPDLLNKTKKCDLIFIDGNHKKENTLHYFYKFLTIARPGAIAILDDIRWSEGMYEAWIEICNNPVATLTVDLFNTGIVFINNKIIKQHFCIYY